MLSRTIILTFILILTSMFTVHSQCKYSKISIAPQMKDSFSFALKWDYSWDISKDEETGQFTKISEGPVLAEDTIHWYHTAHCTTNVQGGYELRYCYADKRRDTLVLTFADGLPAYASEFYFFINGDSFFFRPKTIYPSYIRDEEFSYEITKQVLTLNRNDPAPGNLIIGHLDVEFIERYSAPGKKNSERKFYLKGYLRTTLKSKEE